jgi:PEGA domain
MRASFLAVTVIGALVSASTLATADNRGGGRSSGHSNSGGGRGGSRQGSSEGSRSGHASDHRASGHDSNRGGSPRYSNRGEASHYRAGDGRGYRNSRPSYYRNRSYYGHRSYYRPGFSLYLGSPSYYDSYGYGGYYPETYASVPYAAAPYAPDYGYSAPVEQEQDLRPDADYGDRDGVADAGRLQLDVRPADATIYVDGQFRGTASSDSVLDLAPGRHTVEVVRPGFVSERRVVDIGIGDARSLSIALQPARR